MGSILRCQSLCVIDSCSVSPFSWFILCHLGGLNLVLSIIFCHWLLFCASFFHPFSVTLVDSILCCQSLCVIVSLVVSVHFSHSSSVSLVLSVTLCHWFLFFCLSLFLINPLVCFSGTTLGLNWERERKKERKKERTKERRKEKRGETKEKQGQIFNGRVNDCKKTKGEQKN